MLCTSGFVDDFRFNDYTHVLSISISTVPITTFTGDDFFTPKFKMAPENRK